MTLPVLLGNIKLSALSQPYLAGEMNTDDRVLVLLQLRGGNDGLNTIIPLDQYAGIAAVRSNIMIPENRVLSLRDNLGIHPSMLGVKSLYDEGKVAVIQGVGYPNQNRSHFRSTDIWNTGSASDELLVKGWLGRHLDARYPNFPEDYPSAEEPSPFAIVMGNSVSPTCQGQAANFSMAIADVDNVGQLPTFAGSDATDTPYGRELSWLRTTISQSNQYAGGVNDAIDAGNTVADYPEGNVIAEKLRGVARLISGGLKTKIYVVELGGFDTHAGQIATNDTTTGVHADLLQTLSEAIVAFQRDLAELGLEERVLGMTYSEFGRRIHSNASDGTDHGDAAPLFLFGSCVSGGVIGDNVEIDDQTDFTEGVPMQYDFRNVYGSVLMDWFGVDREAVSELLLDDFSYIPVLSACNTTSTNSQSAILGIDLAVTPNPFRDAFDVTFTSGNERVIISLYDGLGRRVRTIADRKLAAGEHRFTIEAADLPGGTYFVHLSLAGGVRKTKRVVKGK